jgi:hypothetical protein
MGPEGLTITQFSGLEDGYLLSFAGSGAALLRANRVIRGLDPWQRRWLVQEHAWWIADDGISLVARRIPEVAEALGRWIDRPITVEEVLRWERLRTAPRPVRPIYVPPDVAAAYVSLGLAPGAPVEAVTSARRSLARRHHPDAGGRTADMAAINDAADTAIAWLACHPTLAS